MEGQKVVYRAIFLRKSDYLIIKDCFVIAQQYREYRSVCRRYRSRWVLLAGGIECVVGKDFGVDELVGEDVVEDNKEGYCVGTGGANLF